MAELKDILADGTDVTIIKTTTVETTNLKVTPGSGTTDKKLAVDVNGNVIETSDTVTSVNSKTGVVVLDTSDVTATTDKNYVTDAEQVVIGNTSGTNTGDQDLSGIATNATDITSLDTNKADKTNVLELDNTTAFTPVTDYEPSTKKYVDDSVPVVPVTSVNSKTGVVILTTGDLTEDTDKNYVTDAEQVVIGNTSGTNTGDQDISGIATNATDITSLDTNKADKTNVLELDNTTAFTPVTDYEPSTKKYVDDSVPVVPVTSVNSKTGVVVLDTSDVAATTDKNYVTDANAIVIGNTSGTNTGDQSVDTLSDTTITSVADGEVLTYDIATSKWINAAGGGGTSLWEVGTGSSSLKTVDATGGTGDYSITMGYNASTVYDASIGIGYNAKGNYLYAVAIGYNAEVTNQFGIAIGGDSYCKSNDSIALGREARIGTGADGSIVIGANTSSNSKIRQIIIGGTQTSTGTMINLIGQISKGGNYSNVFGSFVGNDYVTYSNVIGYKIDVTASKTFVNLIGQYLNATNSNTILIGNGNATYKLNSSGTYAVSIANQVSTTVAHVNAAEGGMILGGYDHQTTSTGTYGTIINGKTNSVEHDHSVIMGLDNFTTLAATTVYIPKLETREAGEGVIMASPDGTRYKLTVDNLGNLVTTAV